MFQLNYFAKQIIKTLLDYQINYGCLAPGSRSTPFAQVIAREEKFKDFIHFDERSLGFHALGYARGAQKCAPIFITSGSSLANLFPAVVEAFQDRVPLLIFSADRPIELRDCSSNQTIDQTKFFHQYALWHQDLPLYDYSLPDSFIPSLIRHALIKCEKGPVHLNCQFREPFFEYKEKNDLASSLTFSFKNANFLKSKIEKKLIQPPYFSSAQKGLILCGRKTSKQEFLAIHTLAQQLNWPIFPDILSFGRWGNFSQTLPLFELLLQTHPHLSFDVILHFGGPMQSKTLLNWLDSQPFKEYHQVNEEEKIVDPNRLPHEIHPLSPLDFCSQLLSLNDTQNENNFNWIKELHAKIQRTLEKELHDFTEQSLCQHIVNAYRQKRVFFVGASLPIRHLSQFSFSSFEHQIYSNRGASGIDGNLSTAFGLSQALDHSLTLLVGDLTFLYDLNALAQLRDLKHSLDIIVLNNSGGGIFSYLPIRQDTQAHKKYFHTPHSFDLSMLAQPFGIEVHQPKSIEALNALLQKTTSCARLIELCVNSEITYQKHKFLTLKCQECFSNASLDPQASH